MEIIKPKGEEYCFSLCKFSLKGSHLSNSVKLEWQSEGDLPQGSSYIQRKKSGLDLKLMTLLHYMIYILRHFSSYVT